MTNTDGLVFREAYWEDAAAKRAFQEFLIEIHGLDLTAWESAGFWDYRDYRPFSWFDSDGRVVSSAQVYSLEMVVRGSRCRAAQFSGVGTSPDRRRQGLNRRLTEIALEWAAADHDFVFLFADDDAVPFYARCGFLPVEEGMPFIEVDPHDPRPGARPLDLGDSRDLDLLRSRVERRTPVSETFGALGLHLFMFHALYSFPGDLHHIEELDVVVALRREGQRLTLYDVVGSRVPAFDELFPYLASPATSEACFYFVPDKLEIPSLQWRPLEGSNLHDRGDFPLRRDRLLFPFTSHA